MTTLTRNQLGALGGEQLAVEHLEALGLRIVTRNWRCRYGELDIIAATRDRAVVFVEVKTAPVTGSAGGWSTRSRPRRCVASAGWPEFGWPARISVGRPCASM